jgi:hypothetical protein
MIWGITIDATQTILFARFARYAPACCVAITLRREQYPRCPPGGHHCDIEK